MTIGILTYWWSQDNYGQLLQCYALQEYLRRHGHEPFLIRYRFDGDLKRTPFIFRCLKALNPVLLCLYIKKRKHDKHIRIEQSLNDRDFDNFRKTYIAQFPTIYKSYTDLCKNPPNADAYIVGSDQVWSFWSKDIHRYKNIVHAYFLDFGLPSIKRLSYAASWGVTELAKYQNEIVPLLKQFDYVSVREKDGLGFCRTCGRNDVEWVCDPTLLLDADFYRQLYNQNRIRQIKRRYVLLYMLNTECDFDIQKVFDFAHENNYEVVYITGNGVVDTRKKCFATIPEWLYMIDNAAYVITNSFHGSVFSIVFQKPFGIVPLSGKARKMNARFDSLFELCGTGNRYICNYDFSILEKKYTTQKTVASEKFLEHI